MPIPGVELASDGVTWQIVTFRTAPGYMGTFANETAINLKYPVGVRGWYVINEETNTIWRWSVADTAWVDIGGTTADPVNFRRGSIAAVKGNNTITFPVEMDIVPTYVELSGWTNKGEPMGVAYDPLTLATTGLTARAAAHVH